MGGLTVPLVEMVDPTPGNGVQPLPIQFYLVPIVGQRSVAQFRFRIYSVRKINHLLLRRSWSWLSGQARRPRPRDESEVLGRPGAGDPPLKSGRLSWPPKACRLASPRFNSGWIDFGVPGTGPVAGPITPVQVFFAQASKARTGI